MCLFLGGRGVGVGVNEVQRKLKVKKNWKEQDKMQTEMHHNLPC